MKRLLLLFSIMSCWVTAIGQCPPASPFSTPYFEDFSTINNGASGSSFNNCWVGTTTTGLRWESEKAGTGNSSSTGPDIDNSFGFGTSGYYVFLETSSGSTNDTAGFMSPPISLTGLSSPELSFYYHMYGATMGELEVQIWSGTQWDSVWALSGEQQTSATEDWRWASVSLASYTGTIKIKFVGSRGTSFTGDISIDDIRIGEATTCTDSADNIIVNSIAAFEGDVLWTGSVAATSWEVHYYPTGSDFYLGTTITATSDSVRLSSLNSDTEYRIFVREACGSGFGPWSAANQLKTLVSCPAPTGLTLNSTTTTSADLSWTTGGASSWLVEYGPYGFTPGTGTVVTAPTSTGYVLSGLSAATIYDVYVREFCAVGDTSLRTSALTITTLCNPFTAPYFTDFETDLLDAPPLCWSDYETYSGAFVEVEDFTGTAAPYNGSQALYLYSSSSSTTPGADTLYAISPQFSDLTAGDKQIRFYANSDDPADQLIIGTMASSSGTSTFNVIDTITFPVADTYQEVIVPFNTANGYNGTDQYIVLAHSLGVTTDYIRIDDFHYEMIPACTKVTNITLDTATPTTATLSFTSNGSNFDYEYGPMGYTFGQATATTGSAGSNPFTITGLNPATSYDIYIRNNCTSSSNGTSIWEGPFTFKTACFYFAPFNENFETYSANLFGPNIDGCLKGTRTSDPKWTTQSANGTDQNSTGTGPFYDATMPGVSGGMYLFLETTGGSLNDSDYIESPQIDVSALTLPYLGFSYHMYGVGMGTLKVQYSDGGAWTDLITLSGQQQSAGSDPWKTIAAPIYNLTSDTIQFRFIGYRGSSFESDMSIDELFIVEAPSCIPSNFLTLHDDSTTAYTTFVSWTPGTGAKQQVEWGITGYIPGSGAIGSASVTDTFYTITGLNPQTTYDVYVRDSCNGSYSTYTGPVTVTTKCLSATMPYYESFDTWPLSCWDQSGGQDWTQYTGSGGDNYAEAAFWSYNNVSFELNSRPITISQDAQVRIYWSHLYNSSYPGDELEIRAQVVGSGMWTTVLSLTGSDLNDPTASSTAPGSFVESSVLLDPSIYTGQDVIIQIRGNSDWGPNLYINDFYVEQAPPCPDPFGLTVNSLVDTSGVLNWGTSPSHTSFEVWFGPQGFYQGTQTPAGMGARSFTTYDTLLVDTLSSNTCYEFAVRAICGPGDTTTWVGPFQFCTPCSIVNTPYTETFDNWPLSCWDVSVGGQDWVQYTGSGGDNYAEASFWSFSNVDMIMRSRPIMITNNSWAKIQWSHLFDTFYPEDGLTVRAQVLSTGIWDTILHKDGANLNDPTAGNTVPGSFIQEYLPLDPATYTGEVVVFDIIGHSDFGPDLFVNNFVVEDLPSCMFPTNFTASNATTTTIDLSWTTGGASNWLIEYGPSGFTPGTGTFVGVSTNPYTLTGLTPGTLYDIILRDSCGVGDVSLPVGPVTIQTPCLSALSGTYTIGAGGFATLDSAVTSLNLCGISGPVVFNMTGGTHGPISIGNITGASATNTITFNGSAAMGDSIIGSGTFAVELDSAGYINFNDLYIENDGGSFVIWLHNNAHYINIDGCELMGSRTTTTFNTAVVAATDLSTSPTSYGNNATNISISNSTIVGNYYGMSFNGSSSTDHIHGITITDNAFEDQYYYGIRTYYVDSVTIQRNDIPTFRNTFSYGLYCYYNDYVNVTRNNVGDAGTYGMYAYYINRYAISAASSTSTIANNMFNGGTAGIYSYGNQYVNYYHNTLQGGTYGMYLSGSTLDPYSDINIRNNIFINDATGTALYISTAPTTLTLNYNLYYSPNGNVGFQGGAQATLAAWQTAQPTLNVNSVSGDPMTYSATDLHVLGSLANDAGDNTVGINVDIDGDTRPASGSTIVDIGADEYTPVSGDISLFAGDFKKESFCLSSSDTIILQVQNIIGNAVDFSTTPLVANYSVTGPVNSTGTITLNTGTLAPMDTALMMATTIDLSLPGTYTLNAYINPNGDNSLVFNDTLGSVTFDVDTVFRVSPKTVIMLNATDSVEIKAHSPFFGGGNFFITEQCHFKTTSGAPTGGWPSHLTADDYIEITGVPGSDLDGVTLEQWSTSGLANSHTFPSGTVIGPNGTAIIVIGSAGSSVPSPSDFYYHGDVSFGWSSSTPAGRILKDANGNIIDAVGYSGFTFPAAANVPATEWSGSISGGSGTSGNRLEGPDVNSGTNWVLSSSSPQDPNTVNANVTVPAPLSVSGFSWSLNGVQVDTMPNIKVLPTAPGSHFYVATFISPCGTYTDTVEVIVPACLPPSGLNGGSISASSVGVSWDTTGLGGATFEVQYGPAGFALGAGTVVTSTTDSLAVTGLANNLCQDYYVRAICSPTDNSPWVGPFNICPEVMTCDTMDQYAAGPIDGQSSLFIPWQGAPGDAEFSTAQASSGTTSMRIHDSGPAGFSDVVAYFDTLNTGAWEVEFDMYMPSGKAGYFNIQQNHAPNGIGNLWGGEIYFKANGTAEVQYGASVAGTFTYAQSQWIDISVFIDIANDSVWFNYNGISTGVGYKYSLANGLPLQFNGINFYSGVLGSDQADFYVDDFCITPYFSGVCPAPTSLATNNTGCDSVVTSWTSSNSGAYSLLEYGPTGFTPGTGTMVSLVQSPYTITGLTPGTTYEFYVADTCTADTSSWSGPRSFMTLSGPLPVASFVPTVNGYKVSFDATATTGANSYSWDFGDGNTGTGDTTSHTYTAGGNYSVTLTATNSCGTDDTTIVLSGISLGENMLAQSLVVYPNPTSDAVNISFDNAGDDEVTIRVLDLSGKQVMAIHSQATANTFEKRINIGNLADGVYMLEISSGSMKANRRLIKQ